MSAPTDWIWWCSAALLGLSGTGLGAWALLWDRSRGRLRCPRCWYALEGAARNGRVCPECGGEPKSERQMRRTRRRWRWVAVAALPLAAAWVCSLGPRAHREGWLAVTPTLVLLLWPEDVAAPRGDWIAPGRRPGSRADAMHDEIFDRLEEQPSPRWQHRLLGWRVRRTIGTARPGLSEIEPVYRRIEAATIALPRERVSVSFLAEQIESQLGIGVRLVGMPADPESLRGLKQFEFDAPAGSVPLLDLLHHVCGGWYDRPPWFTWTVDQEGIVLGSELALTNAGLTSVRAHDLSRGAVWEEMVVVEGERELEILWPHAFEQLSEDLARWSFPERWIAGGGHIGVQSRIGQWVLVRGTSAMHMEIERCLRVLESETPNRRRSPTEHDLGAFELLRGSMVDLPVGASTLVEAWAPIKDLGFELGSVDPRWTRVTSDLPLRGRGVLPALSLIELLGQHPWRWDDSGWPSRGWSEPLGWRAVGGTLVLSGWYADLESYDARPLLERDSARTGLPTLLPGDDPDDRMYELLDLLTSQVEPRSWIEGGGIRSASFVNSQIIVLQSAPAHIRVRRLLDAVERGAGSAIEVDAEAAATLWNQRLPHVGSRVSLSQAEALLRITLGGSCYVDLDDASEALHENPYPIVVPPESTVVRLLESVCDAYPELQWEVRPGWWMVAPAAHDIGRHWAVYDISDLVRLGVSMCERDDHVWWVVGELEDILFDRAVEIVLRGRMERHQHPLAQFPVPGVMVLRANSWQHAEMRRWLAGVEGDSTVRRWLGALRRE